MEEELLSDVGPCTADVVDWLVVGNGVVGCCCKGENSQAHCPTDKHIDYSSRPRELFSGSKG